MRKLFVLALVASAVFSFGQTWTRASGSAALPLAVVVRQSASVRTVVGSATAPQQNHGPLYLHFVCSGGNGTGITWNSPWQTVFEDTHPVFNDYSGGDNGGSVPAGKTRNWYWRWNHADGWEGWNNGTTTIWRFVEMDDSAMIIWKDAEPTPVGGGGGGGS